MHVEPVDRADESACPRDPALAGDQAVARCVLAGDGEGDDTLRAINAALGAGTDDPEVHAAALLLASRSRSELDAQRSSGRGWVFGLVELIDCGHIDAAAYCAPRLAEAYPRVQVFEFLSFVFRRLPFVRDIDRDAFVDDRDRDVQIVRTQGAQRVLLVCCGARHNLALPLNVIDRWIAHLDAHVVYLRDWLNLGYACGVSSMGSDLDSTVAGLRSLVADIGAQTVSCMGNSAGATGALRLGHALGAERIVALAPITSGRRFSPSKSMPPDRRRKALQRVLAPESDLPLMYRRGGVRARILYGEANESDRSQAMRMAGLPGVTVEAVAGWDGHHLLEGLLRAGKLNRVLGWLTSSEDVLDFDEVLPPA